MALVSLNGGCFEALHGVPLRDVHGDSPKP